MSFIFNSKAFPLIDPALTAKSDPDPSLTAEEDEPTPITINSGAGTITISPGATSGTISFPGGAGGISIGTTTIGNWSFVPIWGNHQFSPVDPDPPQTQIKDDRDGRVCKNCKEFFQFAVSNQTDGSMICWGCRNGY